MASPFVRKIIDALKRIFTPNAAGALIAVAAVLPLERIGAIDIGGLSVRPSQLALLVAIAFAIRGFFRRETAPSPPRLLGWLAAFFAAAAVSLINAENPSRSAMVLVFSVFTASLALLVPRYVSSPERLQQVRVVILISATAVGLFGLWQFLGDMAGLPSWMTGLRSTYSKAILGFTRIQSTAQEPLYFADYLLLPLGLALAWLTDGAKRAWLWPLVLLLSIDLFLTSSRGGYGGFMAMIAVLAWHYRRSLAARRIIGRFAVIGAVVIAASLAFLSMTAVSSNTGLNETFLTHVTTLTDGAAWVERLNTSNGALDAFHRHSIIGVGFGGFGPFVATYPHAAPSEGWPIVNNEYLEILAETGIVGFTLFAVFLLSLFYAIRRPASEAGVDAIRIGALAALVGMLVQYLTFSTLYVMHIWFTIGLALAASSLRKHV